MTGTNSDMAERLLQVIDEGRRTATYKLALLLALMDACAAESDEVGKPPTSLHTRTIALHVLNTYLAQARPFPSNGSSVELRQITAPKSAVFNAIYELQDLAIRNGIRPTASNLTRYMSLEFEECLDKVEYTFARYPIPLLQVVGNRHRPFLYDIDWNESVSLKRLHADGGGVVRLRPGAGDQLIRLTPLLRPLIELHWTQMVARLNDIDVESEHLHAHLFGTERSAFPSELRSGLAELQDGRCFYCGNRIGKRSQIDHFIPWARWPNNAIENLVLADTCNTYKRDYLAALAHVESWSARLKRSDGQLRQLAEDTRWPSDFARTTALARSCYAHLPTATPLWRGRKDFTDDSPAAITKELSKLTAPLRS